MSAISEMLNRFAATIRQHEAARFDHSTDDLGYPICVCAPCIEKSARMNDAFIQKVYAGYDPDRYWPVTTHGEFDYDGDGGREHEDYMRDNGAGRRGGSIGTFVPIADALPVIEAPSIVAELPATEPVKSEG